MTRIAVIGAGISGLTVAHLLSHNTNNEVIVFEREAIPGGLIRCERVEGSLFHLCGGHVFNSKRADVLDWFWKQFDKFSEFHAAERRSVVYMPDGLTVPYPIEDHMYYFPRDIQESFERDLCEIEKTYRSEPVNFEEFLRGRFGETLYRLYFEPYNRKIWRRDLKDVSLSWLEGKLPMPTVDEMRYNNLHHVEEKQFVHSSFFYENHDGSQFLANRLAEGLHIRYQSPVQEVELRGERIYINGEEFDQMVWCGNIKHLVALIQHIPHIDDYWKSVQNLDYHGTTAVFCDLDPNPYTWVYQPSDAHDSHRIICTGNFAQTNNAEGKMTGTVEFTDKISEKDIQAQLERMPFHPRYITHHYSPYTYPIQNRDTRNMIRSLKELLAPHHIFFTGRFADWEYYNMDVAMGEAMDLCRMFPIGV